jgi:hypothetical protein
MGGSGDDVPRHCGGRERGKKDGGSTKSSEFCHVFLPEFSGKHENQRVPAKFPPPFLKDI